MNQKYFVRNARGVVYYIPVCNYRYLPVPTFFLSLSKIQREPSFFAHYSITEGGRLEQHTGARRTQIATGQKAARRGAPGYCCLLRVWGGISSHAPVEILIHAKSTKQFPIDSDQVRAVKTPSEAALPSRTSGPLSPVSAASHRKHPPPHTKSKKKQKKQKRAKKSKKAERAKDSFSWTLNRYLQQSNG